MEAKVIKQAGEPVVVFMQADPNKSAADNIDEMLNFLSNAKL